MQCITEGETWRVIKLKKSHKIVVSFLVAITILILLSELTMPPQIQQTSVSAIKSSDFDPLGSNISFEVSGPLANSSYYAWVNGPNVYEPSLDSFSVVVNIVKTGQNTTGFVTDSTISVENVVYESQGIQNVTTYSVMPFENQWSKGLMISINGLWRVNDTKQAEVYVTVLEQSVFGPFHLPGDTVTISLLLMFEAAT